MKLSLNWLKDYVSVNISPEKLARHLTMAGLEVEKVSAVNGDIILELEITPNRPDCLNVWGLAREAAAVLDKPLRLPSIEKPRLSAGGGKGAQKKCAVTVLDKKGCLRYIGYVIEGLCVFPAPEKIKNRLLALGVRPVNNVVDITNFCLLETGQPLHAFDYDKLAGGRIIVRRAKEGEKIVTIDEAEHRLDPSILVIADAQKPVAVAGIMGGKETEVTEDTRNILLESACFDPVLIRRACRKLGLTSDSSYRFERGVDYGMVEKGARRAVSLILKEAQGRVKGYADIASARRKKKKTIIALSGPKLNGCLGTSLTMSRCRDVLQRLGFDARPGAGDVLKAVPPSWRGDIKEEADVIEEVARIVGYDNLPESLPVLKASDIKADAGRKMRRAAADLLAAQGFSEVITYTMTNAESLQRSGQGGLEGLKIQNPLTRDQEMMRPSLLPSFLQTVLFNFNRGWKNLKIFEIGKIYTAHGERDTAGILMTGVRMDDWRAGRKEEVHFYDLKGVLEQTLERLGIRGVCFESSDQSFFEEGRGGIIKIEDTAAGILGRIKNSVLDKWDIKSRNILFAQMDLETVAKGYSCERLFTPVPEYPAVVRDVSLAVDKGVHFRQVQEIARRVGGDLLSSIQFSEEYLGEKIPEGRRGLVFSLYYQSRERTLREDEVNTLHEGIVQSLIADLGALRR